MEQQQHMVARAVPGVGDGAVHQQLGGGGVGHTGLHMGGIVCARVLVVLVVVVVCVWRWVLPFVGLSSAFVVRLSFQFRLPFVACLFSSIFRLSFRLFNIRRWQRMLGKMHGPNLGLNLVALLFPQCVARFIIMSTFIN